MAIATAVLAPGQDLHPAGTTIETTTTPTVTSAVVVMREETEAPTTTVTDLSPRAATFPHLQDVATDPRPVEAATTATKQSP